MLPITHPELLANEIAGFAHSLGAAVPPSRPISRSSCLCLKHHRRQAPLPFPRCPTEAGSLHLVSVEISACGLPDALRDYLETLDVAHEVPGHDERG